MEEASADVRLQLVRRPARLLRLASDERLVASVRAGDERAFEVLYDRHHRPILGFCRHMLGSREEAEDAVQQTFLSAYRDLLGSPKPIQARPWLFAIARNRCLSMLRARREHAALETAEPSTEGLAATVQRREDVRELLADLARLPEQQRAALLLAELGALDHAGIAMVLGCRREQVKALVFQARSSLAADRQARATPCEDVRELLATATGGTLRRAALRRHLDACTGCRAFKAEVAHQRRLLAVALPVVPTALLKAGALPSGAAAAAASGATAATGGVATGAAAVGAGAATAGGTAAGGGLLAAGAAGVTKVAIAVAAAGMVAGGGAITLGTVRDDGGREAHRTTVPAQRSSALAPTARPSAQLQGGSSPSRTTPAAAHPRDLGLPPRSLRAQDFAPQLRPGAGGNGAAARSFAQTRGGGAAAQQTGAPRGNAGRPTSRPARPPKGTGRGVAERPRDAPGASAAPAPQPKAPARRAPGAPPGAARADEAKAGERGPTKAPAVAPPPAGTQSPG